MTDITTTKTLLALGLSTKLKAFNAKKTFAHSNSASETSGKNEKNEDCEKNMSLSLSHILNNSFAYPTTKSTTRC